MLCMIAFEVKSLCRFESLQAIIFHSSSTFPLGTFHFLSAPPPPRFFEQRGSDFFFKEADKVWTHQRNLSKVPTTPFRCHISSKGANKNWRVGIPPIFRGHLSVCINGGLTVFGFTRILMNIIV